MELNPQALKFNSCAPINPQPLKLKSSSTPESILSEPVVVIPTPQKLQLTPSPIMRTPSAILKPSIQFEGLKYTAIDVKTCIPDIHNIDVFTVINELTKLTGSDYRKTIPTIGLNHQEEISVIPSQLNTIDNGVLDTIYTKLKNIQSTFEQVSIKKDTSFIGKILSKSVDNVKLRNDINTFTKVLIKDKNALYIVNDRINKLITTTGNCVDGLRIDMYTATVMKSKLAEYIDALNIRITSLCTSITLTEQTKQLILVKKQNIDTLIHVIDTTLLIAIPSWFNQMEILEQTKSDPSLIQSLLENKNSIILQLSQISKR